MTEPGQERHGQWQAPGQSDGPQPPEYGGPPSPSYGGPPGWSGHPGWGWSGPPDVKPGVVPLRPLGLGELLDGAITMIRRYPQATLGLAFGVVAIAQLIQLPLLYGLLSDLTSITPEDVESGTVDLGGALGTVFGVATVALVVGRLAELVLTGLITAVTGRAVLGQPVSIGSAWAQIRPQLLRLVGTAVLVALIVGGAVLAGLLPGLLWALAAGGGVGAALLVVLGGLAGGVLAVYLAVILSLATPALVLERQGVASALRRSRLLVSGSWWRVFGILLLILLIAAILEGLLTVPFDVAAGGGPFGTTVDVSFVGLLVSAVGAILAGTLVQPFTAGAWALLYIDQRMRREGLDVTLQRAAATSTPPGR